MWGFIAGMSDCPSNPKVSGRFFIVFPWNHHLQPPRQFTPGKQHASPTAFAFQADVRTEAGNSPFEGATWMRFAQAQKIVELQIGEHGVILTRSAQIDEPNRRMLVRLFCDKLALIIFTQRNSHAQS
jgi:hypothetical protein